MAGFSLDVSFNGKSLKEDFGIGLLSYKIQAATTRKNKGIDISGRDGTFKTKSSYSSKQIDLAVVVEDATAGKVHEKIRKFISWLSQQDEPKTIFTDNPDVFFKADLDSADDYYVTRGIDSAMTQFGIVLYMYDPFTYDNGITSYTWEATPGEVYDVLNEGIHTPYTIRLSGTESALTQYMSTSIGHSTLTTEDGSAISSNIRLIVNGIEQMYSGILSYEDVLEINGKELTVTKNGQSVIADWEGDMNDLANGVNTILISNLENENLFITIEFYRRWL